MKYFFYVLMAVFFVGVAAMIGLAVYISTPTDTFNENVYNKIYNKCISKVQLDSNQPHMLRFVDACHEIATDLATKDG